ncbi:MAG: hypothetical protein GY754_19155 [bacterium]|nr:hypothetical protein [bacterium]
MNKRSVINVYNERGSWLPLRKIPYKEVFCEYPQLATYFFAVPHAILSAFSENYVFKGNIAEEENYYILFVSLMKIFLILTILLLYKLLNHLNNNNKDNWKLSLLMLLPASLYFTSIGFDIVPVFLCILSLYQFNKKNLKISVFILALGVLTKWYLILIFPIYLSYCYSESKKINRQMIELIAIFCFTGIIGICTTLFWGGAEAAMVPYTFHSGRSFNHESLIYFLHFVLKTIHINIENKFVFLLFFMLQFSMVPLALVAKIDTIQKVIKWSALSILTFMFFAKFNTPQWILWILPLLILGVEKRRDIIIIIVFDIVTFLYYPITYFPRYIFLDGTTERLIIEILHKFVIVVRIGLNLQLMIWLFNDLRKDLRILRRD